MIAVPNLQVVGGLTARLHAAARHAGVENVELLEKHVAHALQTCPEVSYCFHRVVATIIARALEDHTRVATPLIVGAVT